VILALLAGAAMSAADAERAFAAAAQTQGQWAAFRRFAAPDAIMVTSEIVEAHPFLAKLKEPAAALKWAPERTVTSCDGKLAFSTGPWQAADGKTGGRYMTIWQRQADGGWKWVYDGGTSEPTVKQLPSASRDVTASCKLPTAALPKGGQERAGASPDGTLRWRLDPGPIGKSHLLRVDYSDAGAWHAATSTIVGG
jgi:hypothetical protein